MVRLPGARVLLSIAFIALVSSTSLVAQSDPDDVPLGDVARNLRKKNADTKPVIDDDNLPQAIERVNSSRGFGSSLRFLMAGEAKGFQVAAPDVTCSLSFTANVKSLLSGQYSEMDLPASNIAKLQAQATIEGDTLTIPVFNGTDWHVSELSVALTLVRKKGLAGFGVSDFASASDINQSDFAETDPLEQVRAEKKPDLTLIYRMRTAAPPWERAVFSAPLNMEIAPGAEWHWSIVQAKGYPPESYAAPLRSTEKKNEPSAYVPSSLTDLENPLAVTPQ
ncbi:MAG TPA: hypothetical protein VMP68_25085 [Candidatus Eisenbacteria bacterium]|nr:hypothetical protein [Candidatus Eisenbacteria bacterium]